jgi:hypothetical protein
MILLFVEELRQYLDYWGSPIEENQNLRIPGSEVERAMHKWVSQMEGETRYLELESQPGHLYAIIGDLHGDYLALDRILREFFPTNLSDAEAEKRHLIFLGDLLDRGPRDFQLLQLVLELKFIMGDRLVLLRGNHEEFFDRGGEIKAAAVSNETYFLEKYQDRLPPETLQTMCGFFEKLPHFVLFKHPRGRAGLMHAGIPPAFMHRQFATIPEGLEVENYRRSFLWGRLETTGRSRPESTYPYSIFFPEDVEDFCRSFNIQFLMRGHDTRRFGYSVDCGGKVITIFSSGAAIHGGESAYVDHVAQPRYLVLNHDQLFTGEKGVGVHEVLDGGISVLEVHTHDYVLILEDEDLNKKYVKLFTGIGELIGSKLGDKLDSPLHIFLRSHYKEDVTRADQVVGHPKGPVDLHLDRSALLRFTYRLSFDLETGEAHFTREGDDKAQPLVLLDIKRKTVEEFSNKCLARMAADSETDLGSD